MKSTNCVEKTNLELAERLRLTKLLAVSPNLSSVLVTLPYKGPVFTIAVAVLTLPRTNGKEPKVIMSEGLSRRSFLDPVYRSATGSNIARERALEALDKKLRRRNSHIGHRFEG